MYMMHACALFKIASYRIENTIEKSVLMIPSPRKEDLLYRKIVYAVVMHQRALQYTEFVISTFTTLLSVLLVIGVSSLSLTLFEFFQLLTLTDKTLKITILAAFISVQFIYMFVFNYTGQLLTNHGLQLFQTCCNGLWYAAPLQIQKLLLFIMQRGRINVIFMYGKIFISSLEGFAMVVSTAISYFMVIYSTRN
ncbi:hypothetical protein P5V15_004468 [Pogonomyrmex californicus]